MKQFFIMFLLIGVISCQCPKKIEVQLHESTTVYYFIRHAEKDRSDPTNKDPELTEAGIERAKKWADFFEKVKIDQIYSTAYKRTHQTVVYLSAEQKVAVQDYDPSNLYTEEFKKLTQGETVLIVGHSNTTPAFVNAIIGEEKYSQINETNNGNLYIVTVIGDIKSVQLLTIN